MKKPLGFLVFAWLSAFLVAAMDAAKGKPHHLEIMIPGFLVEAIIVFLTQGIGTSGSANQRAL
jgi:hypothetical protein